MELVVTLVGLVTAVLVVTGLCLRYQLPAPLVLIVVGIAGSYLPFVPDVSLPPEVVLFGLLPPLLYATAQQTSLVDFRANLRSILLLSIGLVLFTTAGVAVLVHLLLPDVGWAGSFAIGAVVAPPDAVATTAIGRSIGLPRRLTTILEGESLLNDATALVALRTATGAVVAWQLVARDFVVAAGGGVLVGLVLFVVVARLRRHVTEPALDTGIGFVVPFAAYVAAEEIHSSGVLAVVVVGLLLGHKAPILQQARSRMAERTNWRSISFVLESLVFLLIGLQTRSIVSGAIGSDLSGGEVVLVCGLSLLVVIVLRLVWVIGVRLLLLKRRAPLSYTLVLGWAGIRGVVTLAAAFAIPTSTPHRDALLLVAFTVMAGTLFVQGLSLPWLVRRLRLPSPDPTSDALARANLLHQASVAGLARLEELDEGDPHGVNETIRDRLERRDFAMWEQVGASDDETPSEAYSRRRQTMIDAERARVLEIRDTGQVPSEVVSQVLAMLDVEESMLESRDRRLQEARSGTFTLEGDCDHLQQPRPPVEMDTPGECGDCLREGLNWVHLRMCTSCGHVACCDSSQGRHASAHFATSEHPVARSAEPGEDWRWCFVDEITG